MCSRFSPGGKAPSPLPPCSPSGPAEFGGSLFIVYGDFFLRWVSVPTRWGGAAPALAFYQVMRKSCFLALHHHSPPVLEQGRWIIWLIPCIPPLQMAPFPLEISFFLAPRGVAASSEGFSPKPEEGRGSSCWGKEMLVRAPFHTEGFPWSPKLISGGGLKRRQQGN